jgi:hypothetical protein
VNTSAQIVEIRQGDPLSGDLWRSQVDDPLRRCAPTALSWLAFNECSRAVAAAIALERLRHRSAATRRVHMVRLRQSQHRRHQDLSQDGLSPAQLEAIWLAGA